MFRSTNRSLHPMGRMPWIILLLWAFSCIRDPGRRGNKITEIIGFCPRCCCPETVRYQIVFAPPRKSYRTGTGLLFTHKNGCGGAISVTERSCTAPISKVESCTSDRRSHYTEYLFVAPRKSYQIRLLFKHKNGCGSASSMTEQSCDAPISELEIHISDRRSHNTG